MLETVCDLPKLTRSGDWVELIPPEGVVVFNPFTDDSLWVNTVSHGLEIAGYFGSVDCGAPLNITYTALS